MFGRCNLITLRYFWITSITNMCNLMSHYVVIDVYSTKWGLEEVVRYVTAVKVALLQCKVICYK